jgi:hypothetical protein
VFAGMASAAWRWWWLSDKTLSSGCDTGAEQLATVIGAPAP